jgi:hypothetical protein
MNAFWNFIGPLLGLGAEPKDLTFTQISLRGVIIFLITLVMVRLSSKRSLAEKLPSMPFFSSSWPQSCRARSMELRDFSPRLEAGSFSFFCTAFSAGSRAAHTASANSSKVAPRSLSKMESRYST